MWARWQRRQKTFRISRKSSRRTSTLHSLFIKTRLLTPSSKFWSCCSDGSSWLTSDSMSSRVRYSWTLPVVAAASGVRKPTKDSSK